jgi:hypothetical protein
MHKITSPGMELQNLQKSIVGTIIDVLHCVQVMACVWHIYRDV